VALGKGVRVFKIKTGVVRPPTASVRAIRTWSDPTGYPPDYNQSIQVEQAIRILRELEEFRPTFIEQPTRRWT
jgi:muconate cycloisomerase